MSQENNRCTMNHLRAVLKKWAAPLLCGLFFYACFKFVLFIGYVPTTSMEPVIKQNSIVVGVRIFSEIGTGDIVAFVKDGRTLCKRVAAVSGDMVYINDGTHEVSIGVPLSDATRSLIVPEKQFFMLGENRDHSLDSRFWDEPFVPFENIIARVLE